jgi:hypothetical protein
MIVRKRVALIEGELKLEMIERLAKHKRLLADCTLVRTEGRRAMDLTGAHHRCPLCGAALSAPDDKPIGQLSCPRCGAALWVLAFSEGPACFIQRRGESEADLLFRLYPTLMRSAREWERTLKGADSLDLVEVLLEIEERMLSSEPPNS